jgi:hypothetical protein
MESTGILRLVNRFLTGTTAVGDAVPGASVAGYTGQPNLYAGQLGAVLRLNYADAQKRSDPAITQLLQSGRYQYVQFAADGTTYAIGQLLYWKDETNYIVTNVAPTATSANFAGFCISPVTQGNYWLMQTDGVAWVQYRATVTSTTASTQVYALVNTNTVDALADATADATAGVHKLAIGVSKDAPANAGIGRVYLRGLPQIE